MVEFAVAGAAAAEGLVDDLRVARGVQRVDQIRSGYASDNFFDAVAVAVVDDGGSAFLDEVVFEVVDVGDAAGADGVAVGVVGVAGGEAVVGVVVPQACGNGRERGGDFLPIANGIRVSGDAEYEG